MQPAKARKGSKKSKVVAAKQVAAAPWTCQAVQPQHAEAELLEGGEPAVPIYNQVADLETILQERDACGVRIDLYQHYQCIHLDGLVVVCRY